MAGSIAHLIGRSGEPESDRHKCGWSMIENMGDAWECVEELLFVVLATTDDAERDELMEYFQAVKRGEIDPSQLPEQSPELEPIGLSDEAKAYLQVQDIMDR